MKQTPTTLEVAVLREPGSTSDPKHYRAPPRFKESACECTINTCLTNDTCISYECHIITSHTNVSNW